MADEELWHVRIAPNEVKVLTLEQLDDLFRLEVIEADALVWQPGMDEWLPLSVVAGIGDEEPQHVSIPVSQPPVAPAPRQVVTTTATAWPPTSVAPNVTATSWPPRVAAPLAAARPGTLPVPSAPPPRVMTPPPPRSMTPPPPSSRAAAPATASSWPPSAAWGEPSASSLSAPAPALAAGQIPLYPNVPNISSFDETQLSRRSGRGGGWLVAVALAAGLVVSLYRNDVVHAAAASAGQQGSYSKLEAALGGPSFGTPRAVARMTEGTQALLEAPLPVVEAARPRAVETETPPSQPTTSDITASIKTPEPAAKPAAQPQQQRGRPAAAAPARAASRTNESEPDPVFKTPKQGKKGGGNEFDPLNGNL